METDNRVSKSWKILAIIFIILFVLETSLIIASYTYGQEIANNRIKCSNEVCFNVNSESFLYDDATNLCSCYQGEEIIKQEIFK